MQKHILYTPACIIISVLHCLSRLFLCLYLLFLRIHSLAVHIHLKLAPVILVAYTGRVSRQ